MKDAMFLDLTNTSFVFLKRLFSLSYVALAETTAETENYLILFSFLGFGNRPR